MKRPHFYWHRVERNGGYPVIFPHSPAPYTRWQRLHGVQIGPWFIGAVQGASVPDLEPDITVEIVKAEAGRSALRAEGDGE